MSNAVVIDLQNFLLIYLLLIIISIIMKLNKIKQTKLLLIGSIRMTVQLIIAGYVLVYLFENPSPVLVISYWLIMWGFASHRILSVNKGLNKKFKIIVCLSILFSGFSVIGFLIGVVINENIFNPQYLIPISGMVLGNTMTGVSLGIKTFREKLNDSKLQLEVLLNQGATPLSILTPITNKALETALLPTINTMVGMGIVSLPGMMTGQMLSGELPSTAILYQIGITISNSTAVSISVFLALFFGCRTLYNNDHQFDFTKI